MVFIGRGRALCLHADRNAHRAALGAAGLLWPRTRRVAAWGLFALTLAVTPAHFYMLQQPELFPSVPYWALVARLPLQAGLLALIACIALRADRKAG